MPSPASKMPAPRLFRPLRSASFSFANLMSVLALFCRVGGAVSYAAVKIGLDEIADNTVRGRDIHKDTVRGTDIRDGDLKGRDVRDNTITGDGPQGVRRLGSRSRAPGCPDARRQVRERVPRQRPAVPDRPDQARPRRDQDGRLERPVHLEGRVQRRRRRQHRPDGDRREHRARRLRRRLRRRRPAGLARLASHASTTSATGPSYTIGSRSAPSRRAGGPTGMAFVGLQVAGADCVVNGVLWPTDGLSQSRPPAARTPLQPVRPHLVGRADVRIGTVRRWRRQPSLWTPQRPSHSGAWRCGHRS